MKAKVERNRDMDMPDFDWRRALAGDESSSHGRGDSIAHSFLPWHAK